MEYFKQVECAKHLNTKQGGIVKAPTVILVMPFVKLYWSIQNKLYFF